MTTRTETALSEVDLEGIEARAANGPKSASLGRFAFEADRDRRTLLASLTAERAARGQVEAALERIDQLIEAASYHRNYRAACIEINKLMHPDLHDPAPSTTTPEATDSDTDWSTWR